MRSKKSLEQEIEKLTTENIRITNKENSMYEDLHRRFCLSERERDDALKRLDQKENELNSLRKM